MEEADNLPAFYVLDKNGRDIRASKVPGATFEEKATAIRTHCQKYHDVIFP